MLKNCESDEYELIKSKMCSRVKKKNKIFYFTSNQIIFI